MFVKILGYLASITVVSSMIFKTRTYKGTILMRTINLLGSLLFIVWGLFGMPDLLPTVITNVCAVCINAYYLIKEYRAHKLEKDNEIL